MEKRQLAGGQITVWQEGENMIIDHANGLTIELTHAETEALFAWMNELMKERTIKAMQHLHWRDQ